MSMAVGKGMLNDARRDYLARWDRTTEHWDDANARAFAAKYVEPADRLVRQAAEAMDTLSQALERARRECE